MKKLGLLGLLCVLVGVTACGANNTKTLTCTKETTEDGFKTVNTMEVSYKKDKVTKVKETEVEEMDKEAVDMTIGFANMFTQVFKDIDGISMSVEKASDTSVKTITEVDYEKINMEKLKETLGDEFDGSDFVKNKDVSIDDFKKENLDGYTCK